MIAPAICPNRSCGKSLSLGQAELTNRAARCPYCGLAFRVGDTSAPPKRPAEASERPAVPRPPAPAPRPPAAWASLPTTIGKYQVQRQVGEGAFGVVYLARDPELDRDVAVKVLRSHLLGLDSGREQTPEDTARAEQTIARFLREAKVVANLIHGNIVPVYELGRHGNTYFIAAAYIDGQPLSALVQPGGMDPARAVRLVLQLLKALSYAHEKGFLHRDVKPANAMVDNKDNLWLMDFGLAGLMGEEQGRVTQDGSVMGTPGYMSPEQAGGERSKMGPATDQYSVGGVLYQLLTGHLPFEGAPLPVLLYHLLNKPPPPLRQWRRDLDPGLEAICLKALAKEPAGRFADCRAFAETLRQWLESAERQPPLPMSTDIPGPLPTEIRLRGEGTRGGGGGFWLWVFAIALVVSLTTAGVYMLSRSDNRPPPSTSRPKGEFYERQRQGR